LAARRSGDQWREARGGGSTLSRMWPQIALTGFAALLLPSALCVALGVLWQRP